jgi:ornithine carbamoyltransferase
MKKDFISIKDLSVKEIEELFNLTARLKKQPDKFKKALQTKTLALIFEKPSTRTYVSFAVGMYQLGGQAIYLGPEQIKLRVRESIKDVAKTLSGYVDGIVLRTFAHTNVSEMAKYATVPVINGLSDLLHPCQALSDVFTIREKLGNKKGVTLAFIGDGNNVCNSLLSACSKIGINMNVATPKGYEPDALVLKEAKATAKIKKTGINLFHKVQSAAKDADVVYTDVWASMGQETEAGLRKKIFRDFQVNKKLVKLAKEITDEVLDSKNSIIFDQAENRMHVQKAILLKLMGEKK